MQYFHHKPIKRFNLDGIIHDDSAIIRLKNEYIRLLLSEMKLSGYVPRLDIDPDWTLEYNEEKNIFSFEITMYGVYLGKKQAQWIQGIDGTTAIPTQKSKLKEYSQDQASTSNQK
jgi:hypothetical protein